MYADSTRHRRATVVSLCALPTRIKMPDKGIGGNGNGLAKRAAKSCKLLRRSRLRRRGAEFRSISFHVCTT